MCLKGDDQFSQLKGPRLMLGFSKVPPCATVRNQAWKTAGQMATVDIGYQWYHQEKWRNNIMSTYVKKENQGNA